MAHEFERGRVTPILDCGSKRVEAAREEQRRPTGRSDLCRVLGRARRLPQDDRPAVLRKESQDLLYVRHERNQPREVHDRDAELDVPLEVLPLAPRSGAVGREDARCQEKQVGLKRGDVAEGPFDVGLTRLQVAPRFQNLRAATRFVVVATDEIADGGQRAAPPRGPPDPLPPPEAPRARRCIVPRTNALQPSESVRTGTSPAAPLAMARSPSLSAMDSLDVATRPAAPT